MVHNENRVSFQLWKVMIMSKIFQRRSGSEESSQTVKIDLVTCVRDLGF